MKIYKEIQQHHDDGTENEEWLALRKGKITASEVGPFVINKGKVADGAKDKLICKKLAELCGCEMPPNYPNWAMKRGTELEPEARAMFNLKGMGPEMAEVGFCSHDFASLGCSPDGINEDAQEGLEIKCPSPETHVRYFMDGCLPDQYKWQVHHSLAITGYKRWHFLSYCPGAPYLHVVVKRDEFTEQLEQGLLDLDRQLKLAMTDLRNKWEQQREEQATDGKGESQ
jgi:putative phage-type endonuclease